MKKIQITKIRNLIQNIISEIWKQTQLEKEKKAGRNIKHKKSLILEV